MNGRHRRAQPRELAQNLMRILDAEDGRWLLAFGDALVHFGNLRDGRLGTAAARFGDAVATHGLRKIVAAKTRKETT